MDVIVTTTENPWFGWAKSYVAHQPQARALVKMTAGQSMAQTRDILKSAISKAGADGTVIISVGHGTALDGSTVDGMCEIAPGGTFKLVGLNGAESPHTVNVFYDRPRFAGQKSDMDYDIANNPSSDRLARWKIYQEIGAHFKAIKPYRMVLLTCRVGNASDFLKKIANDWGVVVRAYTKRVASNEDVVTDPGKPPKSFFYLFLEGEKYPDEGPNGAELNIIAQQELPYRPSYQISVGPPLPTPP
ncbi:hypothetical protein J8I29_14060 [Labrys sp. LIt4]|uniref:Uncharacterized protein n=1 Tax=Labrys okinawensis TaxID=346911 RepID=A0A2S9QJQ1_9HYPH|nr:MULTISPECIES: hypothetical protein [Labrys]MBP0580444.1 hypothetical protein [Labrys sp. LIt4]PRH89575.1 hypothetical protein C5L14_03165 [Labrys okinawensis]